MQENNMQGETSISTSPNSYSILSNL
jgi:hypothetical protein